MPAMDKRQRMIFGTLFGGLCAVAFLVGLWRDQPIVMAGAFLGGMVAGNVIPYSEVRHLIPWGRA
jgi:hypothetical protein